MITAIPMCFEFPVLGAPDCDGKALDCEVLVAKISLEGSYIINIRFSSRRRIEYNNARKVKGHTGRIILHLDLICLGPI